MIYIGIPFLNRPDLLRRCLGRLDVNCQVCVVNNGDEEIGEVDNPHISSLTVFKPCHNLGVSRSWNLLIEEGRSRGVERVYIGSNDTMVEPGSLATAKDFIERDDDHDMWHLNGYNLFVLNFDMYDTVGRFDENFYPAYKEDQDYHYRIGLSGKQDRIMRGIAGVESKHLGSMTIRSDEKYLEANSDTHNLNYEYYCQKWGGNAGEEKWETPFNGGEHVVRDLEGLSW